MQVRTGRKPLIGKQCQDCGIELNRRPAILLSDSLLCYSCAKRRIDPIQAQLTTKFRNEVASYLAVLLSRLDWERQREAYSLSRYQSLLLCGLGIAIVVTIFLFLNITLSCFWIILSLGVGGGLVLAVASFRDYRFRKRYPEPLLSTPPVREQAIFTDFILFDPNAGRAINDYRTLILQRDQYICQWCRRQFSAKDLEVHHVCPRSRKGRDHSGNLVTLCVSCHLKEYWFDHYHKNAVQDWLSGYRLDDESLQVFRSGEPLRAMELSELLFGSHLALLHGAKR